MENVMHMQAILRLSLIACGTEVNGLAWLIGVPRLSLRIRHWLVSEKCLTSLNYFLLFFKHLFKLHIQ